jgi:hypothetical protein
VTRPRPDWEGTRRQERAGPRSGNGGKLVHVQPPRGKAAEPLLLETRNVLGLAISVGAADLDVYRVRFADGPWLPMSALRDATDWCTPSPRRVPPQRLRAYVYWWIELRSRGSYSFEWRHKQQIGDAPLKTVLAAARLWDFEWEMRCSSNWNFLLADRGSVRMISFGGQRTESLRK